ncbi:hypothetical protein NECID01_1766 [Nematocida sp. AWRm77]|nr:hypothetical protein NECID01_1766 [Nematocida sp. AWRm77]
MNSDIFGPLEESRAKETTKKLLAANRKLQKEKRNEYLELMGKLDMLGVLKKSLVAAKRRAVRRLLSVKEDQAHEQEHLPSSTARAVSKAIAEYLEGKECSPPEVCSKKWSGIAKGVKQSVLLCKEAWYHPSNPYYDQGPFTEAEDQVLRREQGEWSVLYREMKRAPIKIFSRYVELEGTKQRKSAWTPEEDAALASLVEKYGVGSWVRVASHFKHRTGKQCMYRYNRALVPTRKKGKWTPEEDEALVRAVQHHKEGNWKRIKEHIPGRSGPQCRERWIYTLDPQINNTPWTEAEKEKLAVLCAEQTVFNWESIAAEISTRNGRQCRTKYMQMCKASGEKGAEKKGIEKKEREKKGTEREKKKERDSTEKKKKEKKGTEREKREKKERTSQQEQV